MIFAEACGGSGVVEADVFREMLVDVLHDAVELADIFLLFAGTRAGKCVHTVQMVLAEHDEQAHQQGEHGELIERAPAEIFGAYLPEYPVGVAVNMRV